MLINLNTYIMKKILLLGLALTLFSCAQEDNSVSKTEPKKEIAAFDYQDAVTINFINNTTYNYHLELKVKPRYFDENNNQLTDPLNVMPNGLSLYIPVPAFANKYYDYGGFYPFKDLLAEGGIEPQTVNSHIYSHAIPRYLLSSIEFKHPVTGNIIKLSLFDSLFTPTSLNLGSNYFTNNSLYSPWGVEVFYQEGTSSHNEILPNGNIHRFNFTQDPVTYKIVLTINEY